MANAKINFERPFASEIPLRLKGNQRLLFIIKANNTKSKSTISLYLQP